MAPRRRRRYPVWIRDKAGVAGLVIVVAMVLAAVFADQLAPYNPVRMAVRNRLAAPSVAHLLGTDQLGRDVFSRVLFGARVALEVSIASVAASLAFGVVLGGIAGFGSVWLDRLLILVFDAIRSFPTILFAMALVMLVGPSLPTIVLVVVVTSTPVYARIVRTQTQALRTQDFVTAERSLGAGAVRILYHHVLPNLIGPLLILASMDIPVVISIESGLSFLGLGVRPPTPSWGSILSDGYGFIRDTPWLVLAGGLPIVLTTLGFTFLGEALRDAFDPKLRRRA